MVRMRTRGLMILIAISCAILSLPFQCRTPQGEIYRRRADRHDELAADHRLAELRARSRGDTPKAELLRARAEALERQAWVYRKASFEHRRWGLGWPWDSRRNR